MNKPTFGTFRGWSEKANRWAYGHLNTYSPIKDEDGTFISFNHREDNIPYRMFVSVRPESLAMFTGIYDKEDKPIYGSIPLPDGSMSKGGDIVVTDGYTNKEKYIIEFRESAFYMCSLEIKSHIGLITNMDELKIIGNAYENPELLEDNK